MLIVMNAGCALVLACLVFFSRPTIAQPTDGLAYTFTTFAGSPGTGAGDGPGNTAQFSTPLAVALDADGNIYVADSDNRTIRRINTNGIVSTIAGFAGTYGNIDGTNTAARFFLPRGIATDHAGNLYVTDYFVDDIRKLVLVGTNWIVSTIVTLGSRFGSTGFSGPMGIAVDSTDSLYIAENKSSTIQKATRIGTNWVVTPIAGLAGVPGTADGIGSNARFRAPKYLAFDKADNLYVTDSGNSSIRKLTAVGADWIVSTIAGRPGIAGRSDGVGTNALFGAPSGISLDSTGTLYVSDSVNATIRRIAFTGSNWVVTTLAGAVPGSIDGTGANASFRAPEGLAMLGSTKMYLADSGNNAIRRITTAGVVSTLAGSISSAGSADNTGTSARFNTPTGIAADTSGNLYIADSENQTIRMITPAGGVSTIAGKTSDLGNADGVGNNARFTYPWALATGKGGNVYVADQANSTIRMITPEGVVTTIAGSPARFGHDDGLGSSARFFWPQGIAVDQADNIYVMDTYNRTVRKLALVGTNWVVSTLAGSAGLSGSADGDGADARFGSTVQGPAGICVDLATNIYIADTGNSIIRKISPSGGTWAVTTIAGRPRFLGNVDGIGANAWFAFPQGIAADAAGNVYVANSGTSTIRKLTHDGTNWVVRTIGGQVYVNGRTDGTGSTATFYSPGALTVDHAGNLYVADTYNNTIRKGVFNQYTPVNPIGSPPALMTGQLAVTLLPSEAHGQWRFPWELGWRDNGTSATNLVAGNYPIEFRQIPGYLAIPASLPPLQVPEGESVHLTTNVYFPTISPVYSQGAAGSLQVFLGPTPPSGAGWRLVGDLTPFLPSGYTTNLYPGTYPIEFAPAGNRSKPSSQAVQVAPGLPTVFSANYLLPSTAPLGALVPEPIPAEQIDNVTSYPFGFNGQLQSDVGYGSGVAVETNVVLTAAHLVFDDQTLSYVTQAYWFLHKRSASFETQPLLARGFYLLSGYAAQRTNDASGGLGPDRSSPQSRDLDVAAVYFLCQVAGGGYGGYLPSDTIPNPWLTSSSQKMLVGYPVDGSLFGDTNIVPGSMYLTGPQSYPLIPMADSGDNPQVYAAPWLLSYPGNSGGPFYVQLEGYYYPAGIYLGTLYNGAVPYASAIRAIDSNVVNLITRAAKQGDSGTNNNGGGVITIIAGKNAGANFPGWVQWQLEPPFALQAGAGWRLRGDPTYSGLPNYTLLVTNTNVVVEFKQIAGWNLPSSQTITVVPGHITTNRAFYTVVPPVLVADRRFGLGMTGTTGTVYQIETRPSLSLGTWTPFKTNTISSSGFNSIAINPSPGFYRAVWLTN